MSTTAANLLPWYAVRAHKQAVNVLDYGSEDELPEYIYALADGTAEYEQMLRDAWQGVKDDPSGIAAEEFIEFAVLISEEVWRDTIANVIGIGVDEFSDDQLTFLEDALADHHSYLRNSLLPDIIKAIQNGEDLGRFDYRVTILYAGALWSLGNLATITFDGLNWRDMGDLFIFAGPNDEETCTGERGCAQHANKIYTVAQILADDIVPGHMKCITNCRHILLPIASPLAEPERVKSFDGNGAGVTLGEVFQLDKHMPGRHDQTLHTPHRYRSTLHLAKYLASKRERLEASGAKGQLTERVVVALRQRFPDDENEQVRNEAVLLVDVMAMDEERFDYYASKYNIDAGEFRDRLFGWNSEQKQIERELAQAAWRYKDQATVKNPVTGSPEFFSGSGERLERAANAGLVGDSYDAVVQTLAEEYGVNVDLDTIVDKSVAHKDLSRLVNLAREEPALAVALSHNKTIRYQAASQVGARARVVPGAILINAEEGTVHSSTWVHELGHKACAYHASSGWIDEFNRGVHVSSYAWTDPMEDFAETWVATLSGDERYRQQVPGKTAYMQSVIDDMRRQAQ